MKGQAVAKDRNHGRSKSVPAKQTPMAGVPRSEDKTVIVYRQQRGKGQEYIGVRTFNRHPVKGCWYPARRSYVIPIECAAALAEAIAQAADGVKGDVPDWYPEFERQYRVYRRGAVLEDGAEPVADDTETDAADVSGGADIE